MAATNRAERHSILPTSSTTMRSIARTHLQGGQGHPVEIIQVHPVLPHPIGARKIHVAEERGFASQGDDLKPQAPPTPSHLPGVKPGGRPGQRATTFWTTVVLPHWGGPVRRMRVI